MSCPYTSQQNDKAERILRTTNDTIRSLLFQAHLPPPYWVEALHTSTHLLNCHPTKTLDFSTPHQALYDRPPSYTHLRVFGCCCYPNTSATMPHKLAPCSTLCVFLGYSHDHKGYRCLELSSNRVIISRHVVFDETSFPFVEASFPSESLTNLNFLDEFDCQVVAPVHHQTVQVAFDAPGMRAPCLAWPMALLGSRSLCLGQRPPVCTPLARRLGLPPISLRSAQGRQDLTPASLRSTRLGHSALSRLHQLLRLGHPPPTWLCHSLGRTPHRLGPLLRPLGDGPVAPGTWR